MSNINNEIKHYINNYKTGRKIPLNLLVRKNIKKLFSI
jgi:hypothetical protein